MPPCRNVLKNKIERTQYLSQMIKNASLNHIGDPTKGWIIDENGDMEINYFTGNPFPDSIAKITINESEPEDEEDYISSSDYDSNDDDEVEDSNDEWDPKQ